MKKLIDSQKKLKKSPKPYKNKLYQRTKFNKNLQRNSYKLSKLDKMKVKMKQLKF
jgi:hypothetical protein